MKTYLYKTTNKINGRFYIGVHKTSNPLDSYLGSGDGIKRAIEKYGAENFQKEILFEFNSGEEAYEKEKEIVNEDFVKNRKTYNQKIGGDGGWDHITKRQNEDEEFKSRMYIKSSNTLKKQYSEKKYNGRVSSYGMLGKKHSQKTKDVIKNNNSQRLDPLIIQKRMEDVFSETWGWINGKRGFNKRIQTKWGVSHTQVKRFIERGFIGQPVWICPFRYNWDGIDEKEEWYEGIISEVNFGKGTQNLIFMRVQIDNEKYPYTFSNNKILITDNKSIKKRDWNPS